MTDIYEILGEKPKHYDATEQMIGACRRAYSDKPDWYVQDEDARTLGFTSEICSELSRLTTMNIEIAITGSERADWLKAVIDGVDLRRWVEYGLAEGNLILKPNGTGVDKVLPNQFQILDADDAQIWKIVFFDWYDDDINDQHFTRLEYHRREDDGTYIVRNYVFKGTGHGDLKTQIPIEASPWVGFSEETVITGADRMLFGLFQVPSANNLDIGAPLHLPVVSKALQEIQDLDIAYSRFAAEIEDSARTVLLDSDRLLPTGGRVRLSAQNSESMVAALKLPKFVRAVQGSGSENSDVYHEINPTLNSTERLVGIHELLDLVGYKCGFSNGYFVLNERTGMITATQVEADDRRTIQTVTDIRMNLQGALDDLIYALDRFADAYEYAPRGTYEVNYAFDDLTLNVEEDKARWYSYVQAGYVPFWRYLMLFEGYTEEEARKIDNEGYQARQREMGVFGRTE